MTKIRVYLFFLVLEEENAAPTHHLPAGFETDCFFVSASAMGCWLVEATFSVITVKLLKDFNEHTPHNFSAPLLYSFIF
jgi:hypothetical protein